MRWYISSCITGIVFCQARAAKGCKRVNRSGPRGKPRNNHCVSTEGQIHTVQTEIYHHFTQQNTHTYSVSSASVYM